MTYSITPSTPPTGLSFGAGSAPITIIGTLSLERATAATYTYTYTATDDNDTPSDDTDDETATLTFSIAVVDERPALQAIYDATDGANWKVNLEWVVPIRPATCLRGLALRQGIHFNTNWRVKWLLLHRKNLTGSLPAELAQLTSLTHLYLHGNNLAGPIPDLSAMTRLQSLSLYENALTGLPSEADPNDNTKQVITLPASLTQLYLHTNALTGPIPDLSSLSKLQILWLRNNQLTGAIPPLPTSLTTLFLDHNQLSGALTPLGSLSNLQTLSLYNTRRGARPRCTAIPAP